MSLCGGVNCGAVLFLSLLLPGKSTYVHVALKCPHEGDREGKVREEISPFPLLPFCFYITSTLLASSDFNKKGNYVNYFRIDSRALLRGGGCKGG
jgi:hypothetical protein